MKCYLCGNDLTTADPPEGGPCARCAAKTAELADGERIRIDGLIKLYEQRIEGIAQYTSQIEGEMDARIAQACKIIERLVAVVTTQYVLVSPSLGTVFGSGQLVAEAEAFVQDNADLDGRRERKV